MNFGEVPSPPPPTPSNHSLSLSSDKPDAFLSHLHNRLTVITTPLLPLRPKTKTLTLIPPLISLVSPNKHFMQSAATEFGAFRIPESNISQSLYESSLLHYKVNNGVHMYEIDDTDEPYARELRRVGLKVLELLGFERQPTRCLIWIPNEHTEDKWMEKEHFKGCPYILSLQYQHESNKWDLAAAREDTILVTLGDIAKEWSNGKYKTTSPHKWCTKSSNNSMVLLITTPLNCIIAPMEEYANHEGVLFNDPLAF